MDPLVLPVSFDGQRHHHLGHDRTYASCSRTRDGKSAIDGLFRGSMGDHNTLTLPK